MTAVRRKGTMRHTSAVRRMGAAYAAWLRYAWLRDAA